MHRVHFRWHSFAHCGTNDIWLVTNDYVAACSSGCVQTLAMRGNDVRAMELNLSAKRCLVVGRAATAAAEL